MKGLFIFLGGAILGSAITYRLMKNYYDPEIGNGNAFPILRSVNLGVDVKF